MGRVLVTGSDGFVGRALCEQLKSAGHDVVRVTRHGSTPGAHAIGDLGSYDNWEPLLLDIDMIIHLAGRAHVMRETVDDPIREFRRINLGPTERLARAAVETGVRRFVFLSTIGVNGVSTRELPFCESDPPNPVEPYAVSKYEAEQCLRKIEAASQLEVTIVRPPLIYGAGVKGNFLRLLKLARLGVPLPLGAVANRRSFLGLRNFCDLLLVCAFHGAAAGQLFVAADGEDLSTPELLKMMAQAMRRPLWTPRFPLSWLRSLATLAGRRADFDRMTQSLQVDASRVRAVVGWRPEQSVRHGVGEMVNWFLSETPA